MLLSLLPILVITGISYDRTSDIAQKDSRHMAGLIGKYGGKEINTMFQGLSFRFKGLTAEDIFGMAIEFQATSELANNFAAFLEGKDDFLALVLTDKEGKVLESAFNEGLQGEGKASIKGSVLPEAVSHLESKESRSVSMIQSPLMKKLGQAVDSTLVFSFLASGSDGSPIGVCLAYANWARVQKKIQGLYDEMADAGFPGSSVQVVDTEKGKIMAHSDKALLGGSVAEGDLLSWMKASQDLSLKTFDIKGDENIIVSYPLVPETAGAEGGTAETSGLRLSIQVPEKEILASVRAILTSSALIAGAGVAIILVLSLLITRMIARPLHNIIGSLRQGANQVSSASLQISSASSDLAHGASEQAASIEETSASLEEMSSMTRQNADHAAQAKSMMEEASQIIEKVNRHMGDMSSAIQDITTSSNETGKIIKTIDEIAFQTNLLALNAAVEAARAGEAGAGFAVVADEVRNLAMRAAEAAKNTATLIENTIKAVKNGSELTEHTKEAFMENMDISQKVYGLIEEIAAASSEQAQGIEQVSTAVADMDRVVQQAAANSEETAAASEEMNAQSESMKEVVVDLVQLVEGSGRGVDLFDEDASGSRPMKKFVPDHEGSPPQRPTKTRTREVTPQEELPQPQEDEFESF